MRIFHDFFFILCIHVYIYMFGVHLELIWGSYIYITSICFAMRGVICDIRGHAILIYVIVIHYTHKREYIENDMMASHGQIAWWMADREVFLRENNGKYMYITYIWACRTNVHPASSSLSIYHVCASLPQHTCHETTSRRTWHVACS